ncbi:MAG: nucleotidyltransferase family protein [Ruminococcaceae bacterium]|nr:nucleotidyltransferase family protein [Oscillospiraceae bacterium]
MNVGIVCEFNPFHNGHAYLIRKAKEVSGGKVICAMSGNFVQRGEYAFADKYVRAKWAVENGADAVFENPFPFSCATAEKFALGAVSILINSGMCDALSFGCENEISEEELYSVAETILSKEFVSAVKKRVKENKNISFACAREEELESLCGKEASKLLSSPNSLLAVEYAKACLNFGKRPKLFPIVRKGASHDGEPLGEFASGSSIREDISLCEEYCPSDVRKDITGGKIIRTDKEKYYSALCQRIFFGEKKEISEICELPCEYAVKLKKAALECDDFESFFESLRAKHITDAKLRRMLIYLITHTKCKELESFPESAMLLAVSDSGAKFIKEYKNKGQSFVILSKLSDIKKLPLCEKERYEKQHLAESLFKKLSDEGF